MIIQQQQQQHFVNNLRAKTFAIRPSFVSSSTITNTVAIFLWKCVQNEIKSLLKESVIINEVRNYIVKMKIIILGVSLEIFQQMAK